MDPCGLSEFPVLGVGSENVIVEPPAQKIHHFQCEYIAVSESAAEIFDLSHETTVLDDVIGELGIGDALHPLLFGGKVLHGVVGELVECAGELGATLASAHGIVKLVR